MSSRGSLRLQLSLLFDDEQLYDGFLVPMKENKELNPLIIKLLSSYFYNENVRALVDNCSEEEMQLESEQDDNIADMFSNAQQLIACMGVMDDLLKDELDNGISSMTGMMDDLAEKTGGTKSSETDFGVMPSKLNQNFLIEKKESSSSSEASNMDKEYILDESVKILLERYDRRIAGIEDVIKSIAMKLDVSDIDFRDSSETVSENGSSQVPSTQESYSDNFNTTNNKDTIEVDDLDNNSTDIESVNVTEESTSNDVQASDLVGNNLEVKEVTEATDNHNKEVKPIDGSSTLNEFITNAMDIFG